MSMYAMVFGQNRLGPAILATLGLRTEDVGRYRDCFVANGEIAVYTRNGGGNRECSHVDNPEYGSLECKHIVELKAAPESAFMAKEDWPDGKAPGNHFTTHEGKYGCWHQTGRVTQQEIFRCVEPNSDACGCYSCAINHRLPKHPCYLRDEDDDYDCTYATIYFRFPVEYADLLAKLETGEPFDPGQRWADAIEALKSAR